MAYSVCKPFVVRFGTFFLDFVDKKRNEKAEKHETLKHKLQLTFTFQAIVKVKMCVSYIIISFSGVLCLVIYVYIVFKFNK